MGDFLVYFVFTLSMFSMVAYFAIPAIKRAKEARQNPDYLPDDEAEPEETIEEVQNAETEE